MAAVPVVAVALLLAQSADAGPMPRPGDWKFDVLHLKSGRTFPGLVVREAGDAIRVKYVKREPGRPTFVLETSFPRDEIRRIDRLSDQEREVLKARLNALDPTGRRERLLMGNLELQPAPWGDGKRRGLVYTSEYFVLRSDAREDVVRRAAVRLEQVYAAYARYLPPRRRAGRPTAVLLLNTPGEYQALLQARGLNFLNPAFFDADRNEVVCASDLGRVGDQLAQVRRHHAELEERLKENEEELQKRYKGKIPTDLPAYQKLLATRQQIRQANARNERIFNDATRRLFATLYHEAFHAYLAAFVYPPAEAEVPRWLNEGLAQIFETALVEADELRVGHADKDRLLLVKQLARKGDLVPLPELLAAGPKPFLVSHGSDRGASDRVYATSWALAFYLTFELRKLGTEEMDAYVQACKAGADPAQAFPRLVGQDLEKFEKAFQRYVLKLRADGQVDP